MTPQETMTSLVTELFRQHGWIFVMMLAIGILKIFLPTIKGKVGEGFVNLAAKLRLDSNIYRLIKDVTIPSKNGTTQIDHVIVSKFGVFVIETKNYKGWIFADVKSSKWTQVNFKQKHRFQNPLRQNDGHLCALSDLLGISKDKIHGIVCFMGNAKFKTEIPEGVFLEGSYVSHIKSFQTSVFTDAEVADLIQRIESGRLKRGFKTNRAHVQQLKSRRSEIKEQRSAGAGAAAPSQKNNFVDHDFVNTPNPCPCPCPACGADMVLRTAKRGANAGNQFWGCSNYPSCRSTQPV